jgi:acyl-CoA thioester hydrolase
MSISSEKKLITELDFTVRTYDIDFANHVSNQVYIRWLEDLRFELLQKYHSLETLMGIGAVPFLIETNIKYRKPIVLFEAVKGRMWLESMEAVRLVLRAEITVNDEVRCAATQKGAFVNTATGMPIRPPEDFRRLIEM